MNTSKTVRRGDPSIDLIGQAGAFRWYWAGQSLSFLGSHVAAVALPLVAALSLGAGPAGVSAVATAAMLPNLLFSLVVGNWVEGRDHRRIMIPADLVRALLVAAIPVAWLTGVLSLPLLVVVAFLTGTAGIFFDVAGFAYVPSLVPDRDLGAANRAVQGSSTVAEVSGPGLAGLLVQAMGPALAMVVDAVSYLASALGVLRGRPSTERAPEPRPEEPVEKVGFAEGLRVLFASPYLRALTVHAAA